MAQKSRYLKDKLDYGQACFVAGCEISTQQMFDMMCLVLHDPDIMGKDTFGADRLKKIHEAMRTLESKYHDAWMHVPESDYLQEKLDASLREIFPDCPPFAERYVHTRQWDYFKPERKKQ